MISSPSLSPSAAPAANWIFSGAPLKVSQFLKNLKAEKPKIKIRCFLEGNRETEARNRITGKHLKMAGIKVVYGSTHAKGVCVDGRYLLIGSTNLTTQSILRNNETNVLIGDEKIAAEFTRYFNFKWKGGEHGDIHLREPMYADGDFEPALIDVIDHAKKQLSFSIYFFDSKPIQEALIRAHKRKVKILGFLHQHRSFALSYVRRTARTAEKLGDAGIKGLFWGPPHLFTHSKYLVADRKIVMIGTGNWLREDVTTHPQLYLKIENEKLARELETYLKKKIKSQATKPSFI